MTDARRVQVGRTLGAVGVVSALTGLVVLLIQGKSEALHSDWVAHTAVLAVGFGLMTWLVLPSQPRNRVIWVSASTAFFTGLYCLLVAILYWRIAAAGITTAVADLSPSQLPRSIAPLLMFTSWLYIPQFLALTAGFFLFPDGIPPTRRWRWLLGASIGFVGAASVGMMWAYRPSGTIPYWVAQSSDGPFRDLGPLTAVGHAGIIAMIPVSFFGMIQKLRRSRGTERQQFRWVVWGAATIAVLAVPVIVIDVVMRTSLVRVPFLLGLAVLVMSYAMAIGRYRLYDVDLVISKTLVYGALALLIAGLYVGIVVVVGSLLGIHRSGERPSTVLGLAAVVVIPIVFQPARRYLERWANRVVLGRRATPYEVLSSFSQKIAAVDPGVLTQIARSLAEGTTAQSATIWAMSGPGPRLVAAWPEGATGSGSTRSTPIVHDGEHLGDVNLTLGRGQVMLPTDERLLAQVSAGLGLALRNLALTEDLRDRVDQLRQSRSRVVEVQDRTRRQLERDLHDGAQQRLVALKIKLGLASAMARKDRVTGLEDMLDDLRNQADRVIANVREFARGIYPPLLEAEGLVPALTANIRTAPIQVGLQAGGVGRYPRETEATVYFCVLQAVSHATSRRANSIQIVLDEEGGSLSFEVRDDGNEPPEGGLINLVDRLEAAGGTLNVSARAGHGTLVVGRLPVERLVVG